MKLLFLSFLLFLLYLALCKEGFDLGLTVGEHEYLKPSEPAVLSEELENNFIEAYNKNASTLLPTLVLDKDKMNRMKSSITVEEVKYYVNKNKWPYGSALTYCLEKNVEKMPLKKVEEIQKIWPTRIAFSMCNGECKEPASLECKIYSGK